MSDRILIISDDVSRASLEHALVERGFDVSMADNPSDGYQRLIESRFKLAVVNLERAASGLDLIKRIRSNAALNRLFVLTIAEWGSGQPTVALAHGADGFEPTPIEGERLVVAVEKLLRPNMVMTAKASATRADLEE